VAVYRAKPPHGSPLNRSDRLAKGLVGAWPLADKSGPTARDAAGGKAGDGTLTSGPTWGTSPWGAAVTAAASPAVITVAQCALTSGAFSFGALAKADIVGFNTSYAVRAAFNSNADLFSVDLDGNASPAWRLIKTISFSSGIVSSDAAAVAGQWYKLLGIVDDAGALSLWVDGKLQAGAATKAGSPTGAGTLTLAVGGSSRDISVAGVWIWNRPLSPAAARAWSADPFRMFRPRRLPVPLKAAAAATGSPAKTWLARQCEDAFAPMFEE
jgi:hypothetical protein